jgi:hypothetical protein
LTDFKPSASKLVDWNLFPEFSLPFQVIYGGNIQNGNLNGPLNHGFSHISDFNFLKYLPIEKRAMIYYGAAYPNANQPWENLRSPWGNNLETYSNKWNFEYDFYADLIGNKQLLEADIFAFDIEAVWRFDHEILALRDKSIPAEYKVLNDADFLKTYKRDMRNLYASAVKTFMTNGKQVNLKTASYADSPIVNTFSNIQGKTWEKWQTDKSATNFITNDEEGNIGGEFYNNLDIVSPSTYYYYDYPHPFAGEYLSYLLFQIEANKAWTNKPVIPFVWLRYSFISEFKNKDIKPWMAEATAIFPFFSGADGLWLWDNSDLFNSAMDFTQYEYFNKGLFRLSEFKSFFEGEHKLVIETSARNYNENKQPIWRGVVKGNEILIAAHNPFAKNENEEVNIGVSYGNFSRVIKLKGYEVFLCKFDMSTLGLNQELPFNVYPNPVADFLKVDFESQTAGEANIRFFSNNGRLLKSETKTVVKGINNFEIDIKDVLVNQFIINVIIDNQMFTKKVIKVE